MRRLMTRSPGRVRRSRERCTTPSVLRDICSRASRKRTKKNGTRGAVLPPSVEPADKPGSVVSSHSSRPCVAARLEQPTRERRGPRHDSPIRSCSRWGLPCHAALAPRAVRSYRTFSPLPRTSCDAVRRFAFCCTFRRLAPPRRYLAPCPVEPGLSSAQQCDAAAWPTPRVVYREPVRRDSNNVVAPPPSVNQRNLRGQLRLRKLADATIELDRARRDAARHGRLEFREPFDAQRLHLVVAIE